MSADATARPVDPADYERFVAFAFAAADIVVELDPDRRLVYAAGTFRADLGCEPDDRLGRPVTDLVAPIDHELLQSSLAVLQNSGRLPRCVVRLANQARTPVALSGLALPSRDRPPRLCLSLSLLPGSPGGRVSSPGALLRQAETCVRAQTGRLDLLEIVVEGNADLSLDGPMGAALRSVLPNAVSAHLSNGRIGVLEDVTDARLDVAAAMAETLRSSGVRAKIVSHHLALSDHDLTPPQAARALRHAVSVFARDGATGLLRSGFDHALTGYLAQSSAQVATLRRTLRSGSFDLLYQPIVSLRDRRITRYEALIRPHGLASGLARTPQDFVMMVESIGMAEELDGAVARRVCEAAIVSGHPLALNLSSQSVQSPAFRRELLALLEASRASERQISIEMTETADIDDLQQAAQTADELRRIGVALAIDDFGAGTAGIDVLRAMKPDIVKVDGSYTHGVTKYARDRALFSAMADLVRATGAQIVAERVETEREAEELVALGVDFGQGWLFGRPGPLPLHASATPPRAVRRRQGEREVWGR